MLSAAAALTRRVRVFATVFVLPMHDPVWLAKQIATLDVLSGGRFVLGVGAGAREEDYRSVGRASRRQRGWRRASRRCGGSGRRSRRFPGAHPVGPRPLQAGGPPVLVGALAPRAIARAASWADGLAGFSLGPDPGRSSAASARRATPGARRAGARRRGWSRASGTRSGRARASSSTPTSRATWASSARRPSPARSAPPWPPARRPCAMRCARSRPPAATRRSWCRRARGSTSSTGCATCIG